jgi:hypothetical protein
VFIGQVRNPIFYFSQPRMARWQNHRHCSGATSTIAVAS